MVRVVKGVRAHHGGSIHNNNNSSSSNTASVGIQRFFLSLLFHRQRGVVVVTTMLLGTTSVLLLRWSHQQHHYSYYHNHQPEAEDYMDATSSMGLLLMDSSSSSSYSHSVVAVSMDETVRTLQQQQQHQWKDENQPQQQTSNEQRLEDLIEDAKLAAVGVGDIPRHPPPSLEGDKVMSEAELLHNNLRLEPPPITERERQTIAVKSSSDTNEDDDDSWMQEQTAAAWSYVQSFSHLQQNHQQQPHSNSKSRSRPLKFLHIPKTAGTAVEYAAGQNRIPWGSCLFNHKPKRDICRYPKNAPEWPQYLGWWHLPAQLFPLRNINPYRNAELFGVIRDPYDRMVSEFYYICTLKVFDWRPNQCDRAQLTNATYMNQWLTRKIRNRARGNSGLSYLTDNGHFTPQYDFIVGPNQVRMIDYVLTMTEETLADDFARLMRAFGLSHVQLQKLNALGASARGPTSTHLGVEDLDETTLKTIHEMYPLDFALGNYAMRTVPPVVQQQSSMP